MEKQSRTLELPTDDFVTGLFYSYENNTLKK